MKGTGAPAGGNLISGTLHERDNHPKKTNSATIAAIVKLILKDRMRSIA